MSIVRRTSLAIIASLVLLGACERASTHSEPAQRRPAAQEKELLPGGPPAFPPAPAPEDTTELVPRDTTTAAGGGMHGSGG